MEHGEGPDLWMDERREAALIRAAQGGDRRAFTSLVEHYLRQVYRLAYALTRDHGDATSLARETFDRAWAGIKGIPSGKRFFPWTLRMARNLSVAHARRRAGEPTATAAIAAMVDFPDDGDAAAAERLLDALRDLRPDEQMALALRVVERLPYGEIARLLDHSPGVTLARLSAARGVLLERAGGSDAAEP